MKKIAVITGASSGMGRRFAETVDTFDRFDEVWVIARHEKALEELRDRVPYPIRALALDLTDRRSFQTYADALAEEPVEVGLLVNASGFGKFRAVVDTPLEVNLNMTDLNCQAVVALCQLTAPCVADLVQGLFSGLFRFCGARFKDILNVAYVIFPFAAFFAYGGKG